MVLLYADGNGDKETGIGISEVKCEWEHNTSLMGIWWEELNSKNHKLISVGVLKQEELELGGTMYRQENLSRNFWEMHEK